jgi:UDP-3-O-[3-hydroxymyristoyl] glucosamine N-acyltransferase
MLNVHASIGHDVTVGAHSVISPYAFVAGHRTVGEACFLGSASVLTPHTKIGSFSEDRLVF